MPRKNVESSPNSGQPFILSSICLRMQLGSSIRFFSFWLDNTMHRRGQGGLNCRCHLTQPRFGDGTCISSVLPPLISCIWCSWYRQPHTLCAVAFTSLPCVIISIRLDGRFNWSSKILSRANSAQTNAKRKSWKKFKKSSEFKRRSMSKWNYLFVNSSLVFNHIPCKVSPRLSLIWITLQFWYFCHQVPWHWAFSCMKPIK